MARSDQISVDDKAKHLDVAGSFVGCAAGNHLVKDDAERIDVSGRTYIVVPGLGLLRCHVLRCAKDLPRCGFGWAAAFDQFRQSEIHDPWNVALATQVA